jgi:hypothetical protein
MQAMESYKENYCIISSQGMGKVDYMWESFIKIYQILTLYKKNSIKFNSKWLILGDNELNKIDSVLYQEALM